MGWWWSHWFNATVSIGINSNDRRQKIKEMLTSEDSEANLCDSTAQHTPGIASQTENNIFRKTMEKQTEQRNKNKNDSFEKQMESDSWICFLIYFSFRSLLA